MPEGTTSVILAYIGMTTLTLVAARFVDAPYFVWKEQNQKIKALKDELDAPNRSAKESVTMQLGAFRINLARGLISVKRNLEPKVGPTGNPDDVTRVFKETGATEDHFLGERKFLELWNDVIECRKLLIADIGSASAFQNLNTSIDRVVAYLQFQD